MNPLSLAIMNVHPVGVIQKLIPLPSASLFKTLLVQGTDTVAAFQSDPLQAPPSSVVTLPISSGALKIVVD